MKKMKDYLYHIGLKLRIYPSDVQKTLIKVNGGASRYIYNKLVAYNNEIWLLKKSARYSPTDKCRLEFLESVISSKANLQAMIPFLAQANIDSGMIDHAIANYKKAWTQYRKVSGTSVPTFHKKDNTYSYCTSNHYGTARTNGLLDGSISFIDCNHIFLPKIGKIRFKGSKKMLNRIFSNGEDIRLGTVAIDMDATGCCYASLSLASDIPFHEQYSKSNTTCGIDLNLTNFLKCSDGSVVESPKFLRKAEKKLKKAQRRLSNKLEASKRNGYKYYDSKRYCEQRKKLAHIHKHIANQRANFYRITAQELVKNHDYIFAENLKVKNLIKNHKLAKAIQDSGWRSFLTILEWCASKHGRTFMMVNPKNTTQTCSVCGNKSKEKIELGVEEWTCQYCGTHHDRDTNAAINIRNVGLSLI